MIVSFIIRSCCISMMRGRCNKQENTGDVLRLFHAKVCGEVFQRCLGILRQSQIQIHEMIHVVCHSQQHRSRLLFFWISHTPGEEPASKKQRREEFVLICFL